MALAQVLNMNANRNPRGTITAVTHKNIRRTIMAVTHRNVTAAMVMLFRDIILTGAGTVDR